MTPDLKAICERLRYDCTEGGERDPDDVWAVLDALDAAERDAVALATRIESYVHIRERDGDSGTTRRAIADMGRMAGEMLTKYPEAKQ